MKRSVGAAFVFAPVVLLAACGGGGGGGGVGPPTSGGTPAPTQTPATTTTASGTVVNRDTNAPIAGVLVAISPWVGAATPMPQTTTNPQGQFSFTAPNGHYLLYIGSDNPTDPRATVHANITLNGGNQPLVAPTAWPLPSITPPPSEKSGAYRLMTLNTDLQTPCLLAVNQQRVARGLNPLVADEWLEENAIEINQAQNNLNLTTLGSGIDVSGHNAHVSGQANCAEVVSLDFVFSSPTWSTPQIAQSNYSLWYGGAFSSGMDARSLGASFGYESYGLDARLETPCPSPPPTPLPAPGPGSCDPYYAPWP